MILTRQSNNTYLKVLLDKKFFTINPIAYGFMGFEVRLHIGHKAGEKISYVFDGECDGIWKSDDRYKSSISFHFSDYSRFLDPEEACKYILDNIQVYKYVEKDILDWGDDKTVIRLLGERLSGNYIN
jgi:hypothetical protein